VQSLLDISCGCFKLAFLRDGALGTFVESVKFACVRALLLLGVRASVCCALPSRVGQSFQRLRQNDQRHKKSVFARPLARRQLHALHHQCCVTHAADRALKFDLMECSPDRIAPVRLRLRCP
jgi:hypothetical protein